MKNIGKPSFWLSIFEQIVYIVPTLTTVLYYYFDEIQYTASATSKFTFATAVALFVFFIVYKHFAKTKLQELRQSVVQTETDLKNEPESNVEKRALLAENARKDRTRLDTLDRAQVLIGLVIFALAVYIVEQATIGLTTLAFIALCSIAVGTGIHVGVLKLKTKEAVKQ